MRKFLACLSVLVLSGMLLFTAVPAATAKEAGPFYVGLYGGWVMPQDLEGEEGDDLPLKDSWALGAKFGYIIPTVKWLAVELDYAYLAKQDVDEPGTDGDFKASNLMFNLIARYPEGKIHPYIGAGIGWSWGSLKATGVDPVDGPFSADLSDNAFAWQILAGVNFEITPQWSADLGYRYFQCKYKFESGGESEDATAKNHMILIGVNFHF